MGRMYVCVSKDIKGALEEVRECENDHVFSRYFQKGFQDQFAVQMLPFCGSFKGRWQETRLTPICVKENL